MQNGEKVNRTWMINIECEIRDRLEFGKYVQGSKDREGVKIIHLKPEFKEVEIVQKLSHRFE